MQKFQILLLVCVLAMGLLTACDPSAMAVLAAEKPTTNDADSAKAIAVKDSEASTTNCDKGYAGETIYLHQQAGREGPIAALLGDGFAFATQDAIAEINATGGICGATLELVFRETQYDLEQELSAYEEARAFDPKPITIMTYNSGATVALKDRFVEDEIVNIVAGVVAEAIYDPPNGYSVAAAPIYSDQFAGFVTWLSENWAEVKPEGASDEIVVGVLGWANAFGAGATTPEALAIAESVGVTVLPLEEMQISPEADITEQIQHLLQNGANVIYNQNISFSTAQAITTLHELGAWDQVVAGGVNWSMNDDVISFLGDNVYLADGYYGVYPYVSWNDTDSPAIQRILVNFEANEHPASAKSGFYLLTYGSIYALVNAIEHAINRVGFENLDGAALLAAMEELGTVDAAGLYKLDVRDGNRAPRKAQIRQMQMVDGKIEFVVIEDFFELPDARPLVSNQ